MSELQEKLLVRSLVYLWEVMKLFTGTHWIYIKKWFKGSRSNGITDKHYMDWSEIITFFYVFPVEAILWRNYYRQRDPPGSCNETKLIDNTEPQRNLLNFYEMFTGSRKLQGVYPGPRPCWDSIQLDTFPCQTFFLLLLQQIIYLLCKCIASLAI